MESNFAWFLRACLRRVVTPLFLPSEGLSAREVRSGLDSFYDSDIERSLRCFSNSVCLSVVILGYTRSCKAAMTL